jgi:2-polyprenyl-3-methyl-5-hydroxy-6-metoxy-1,4-benzoquinol methylase
LDYIQQDAKVMIAGCGNSNLIQDMADDGYQELIGYDVSRVVIHEMSLKLADYEEIEFIQVKHEEILRD